MPRPKRYTSNLTSFSSLNSEADTEIASLACAWNCPVLSDDSDFFIFDIKAGYIPFGFLKWNSSYLRAKIFYRQKLESLYRIRAELIPLWASLAGNDYVSRDLSDVFSLALNGFQHREHTRLKSIAYMLSNLSDSNVEEALKYALEEVKSAEKREELRQAVKLSLQEYTLSESNLLGYFQDDLVSSSLTTQSNREINQGVLRRFRNGKISSECISSLTSGKVFLKFPVENCKEISANCCSKRLRRFTYGILNDAVTKAEEGNIKVIQEWDREGKSVNESNVEPNQEGVVLPLGLNRDLRDCENFLLFALDSDTTDVRALGERFILIAASLRYLIKHAQPSLETNHLIALLCCCVNLENGEFYNGEENTVGPPRSAWPFDIRAAQSFAQWQCVLRDTIHLNYTLHEPVPVPCIHKTFNGKMAQKLLQSLEQGKSEN